MILLLFFISFFTLILGAEILVRGSSQLAAYLGISPLIIGLTVVAFGTSSPELMVSVVASLNGETTIALGNVIGSNIINILLILGGSALLVPLQVHEQLVIFDVPVMIGVTSLFLLFALFGVITPLLGLVLLFILILYILFVIRESKKNSKKVSEFKEEFALSEKKSPFFPLYDLLYIIVGIIILQQSSEWMVKGAVLIATYFAISPLVISLTIVSLGTSIPELATSLLAAVRKKRDIAVGNIIGSNIFNLLAVLGSAALVSKEGIIVPRESLVFDIPVMVTVSLACLPIFLSGHLISRWEGALFVGYYFIYVGILILQAKNLIPFSSAFLALFIFVIPLFITTLYIFVKRILKS